MLPITFSFRCAHSKRRIYRHRKQTLVRCVAKLFRHSQKVPNFKSFLAMANYQRTDKKYTTDVVTSQEFLPPSWGAQPDTSNSFAQICNPRSANKIVA